MFQNVPQYQKNFKRLTEEKEKALRRIAPPKGQIITLIQFLPLAVRLGSHNIFCMPNAAVGSTFVYLSNVKIPFDRAWKAAGFSSHTEDYYSVEDAVLVDWINE